MRSKIFELRCFGVAIFRLGHSGVAKNSFFLELGRFGATTITHFELGHFGATKILVPIQLDGKYLLRRFGVLKSRKIELGHFGSNMSTLLWSFRYFFHFCYSFCYLFCFSKMFLQIFLFRGNPGKLWKNLTLSFLKSFLEKNAFMGY